MASSFTRTGREAAIHRLYCIVLGLLLCLCTAQGQDITVVGSLPFGATYVADGWMPVRVDVKNDTDREVVGTVRVLPINRAVAELRTPVKVPAKSRLIKTLWGYFPVTKESLIARVTLNDASGAQLARVEMTGASSPAETQHYPNGIFEHGLMIGISGEEDMPSDYDTLDLTGEALGSIYELRSNYVQLDSKLVPNSWVPYRSAFVIQMRSMDPDVLSPEGREAILDYVRAGGVLLLSAPDARQVGGSWVEPLLPVRLIGNRELNEVPSRAGDGTIKFAQYMKCAEALAGDGEILLRDGKFIHAAYRKLGLGRVVFSSFPAGALPVEDTRAGQLWYDLLGFGRPPIGLMGSVAQDKYRELMEPMLGRKAASWGIAAGAVGLLVVLVLAAHLAWRGASRPKAFKISLAASVLIAAGFSLMAAMRQESEPLQEARLTLVDASAGGSLANEYAAVSGSQQLLDRGVTDSLTALRTTAVRQDQPVLTEWPATVQRIEVNPPRVELVSLASKMDENARASAVGQFGPEGLELTLNNGLGSPLSSAQLGWGLYRMSMPAIAEGDSKALVSAADVRPMDEYVSASGLASQEDQHRGQILKAVLTSRLTTKARGEWPTVFGWADRWPELTKLNEQPGRSAGQTLVRIPLSIGPSQGPVQIDGVFNDLYLADARGLPYDTVRREFIRTTLPGDWIVAVQYPQEIGVLKPSKARLRIELATSQHVVQVRAGQCVGGKRPTGRGTPNGRLIANWPNAVGMQSAEIDCTPEDYDEQGRLWLRISVQSAGGAGSMGVEPQWQFGQFLVDLEGDVTQSSTQP